jgi:exopolyphosphatase / guanosine-5'-triphosphate,3'-diphosphate pyrophosphatase
VSAKLRGVIDIGSNSALLLIASLESGGLENEEGLMVKSKWLPRLQRVEVLQLGVDLTDDNKIIRSESLALLESKMISFRESLDNCGAELVDVIMTEAVRRAENSLEVLWTAERVLRYSPRVITGEEEAELTWKSVCKFYELDDVLTLDIGAGSVELSDGESQVSWPIGVIRMVEKFGFTPDGSLKQFLDNQLAKINFDCWKDKQLYVTGGTAVALGMMILNTHDFDDSDLEGLVVSKQDLENHLFRLRDISVPMRDSLPGLQEGRGKLIQAGMMTLEYILERLGLESFFVSSLGVRYGALVKKDDI